MQLKTEQIIFQESAYEKMVLGIIHKKEDQKPNILEKNHRSISVNNSKNTNLDTNIQYNKISLVKKYDSNRNQSPHFKMAQNENLEEEKESKIADLVNFYANKNNQFKTRNQPQQVRLGSNADKPPINQPQQKGKDFQLYTQTSKTNDNSPLSTINYYQNRQNSKDSFKYQNPTQQSSRNFKLYSQASKTNDNSPISALDDNKKRQHSKDSFKPIFTLRKNSIHYSKGFKQVSEQVSKLIYKDKQLSDLQIIKKQSSDLNVIEKQPSDLTIEKSAKNDFPFTKKRFNASLLSSSSSSNENIGEKYENKTFSLLKSKSLKQHNVTEYKDSPKLQTNKSQEKLLLGKYKIVKEVIYKVPITPTNQQLFKQIKINHNKNWNLSQFKIIKEIGEGQFAKVFMAKESKTQMLVALKVIDLKKIDKTIKSMICDEIKIHSFCNHKNILSLYGVFIQNDQLFMIMELIVEGTLFKYMTKQKRLNEQKAANVLYQISSAVKYLHENNIIHRDIKPENILMKEPVNFHSQLLFKDIYLLSDFGIATVLEKNVLKNTFCGTLDYASPEIIYGDYYDFSVDLWALGVLTYEICSGLTPYKNDEVKEKRKIFEYDLQYPKYFSNELKSFISGLLEKNPLKRMSIDELLNHKWIRYNIFSTIKK